MKGAPAPPGLTVTNPYRPSASVPLRPHPNPSRWPPSASACQISTIASMTGSPAPSSTRPAKRRASARPGSTSSWCGRTQSPTEKNGPTVCEGVAPGAATSGLEEGRVAAAEDDGEAEAERPLLGGRLPVELRDQPLPRRRVADGIEDRVGGVKRIAGEVHPRHQPLGECAA